MADGRGRRRCKSNFKLPVRNKYYICFIISSFFIFGICNGYEESYSISQMSPKSAIENRIPNLPDEPQKCEDCTVLETSEPENVFEIQPSLVPNLDKIDNDVLESIDKFDENIDDVEHIIVARSAAPILNDRHSRSLSIDDLTSSKDHLNEFDTNEVEVQNKQRYYNQIQPTRTLDYGTGNSEDEIASSQLAFGLDGDFSLHQSGEYRGVSRGRALPPSEPHTNSNAAQKQSIVTDTPKLERVGRQQNHNVQDIITNIVKLLNGNVNVQAATQLPGRPLRPMSSRINNRGPPRISDVPPLPEFDNPGPLATPHPQILPPTKFPPPYPFDRPHNHNDHQKPFPEQIGPNGNQNHRPHGNFVQNSRPTNLPPWQRPRPRPPNRRPNPNLPMYKPIQNAPLELPPYNPQDDFATRPTADQEFGDKIQQITHNAPDDLYNTQHTNNIQTNEQETTSTVPNTVPNVTDLSIPVNTEISTLDENRLTKAQSLVTSTEQTTVKEAETTIPSIASNETVKTDKPYKLEADKKKGIYVTDKDKITSNKKEDKRKNVTNEMQTRITSTTERIATQDILNISHNEVSSPSNDTKPILEPSMSEKPMQSSVITPISTPMGSLSFVTSSVATPALESVSSQGVVQSSINTQPTPPHQSFPYYPYKPRPGIVLDDTDFKPKPHHPHTVHTQSVITAPPAGLPEGYGEIFHVTVSAIQGPGSNKGAATVHIENVDPLTGHLEGSPDDIIISPSGDQGFVSIDGKRTYLNLFGDEPSSIVPQPTAVINPTRVQQLGSTAVTGSGIAIPAPDVTINPGHVSPAGHVRPQVRPQPGPQGQRPPGNVGTRRPQVPYRPQPTVRIDTCIVGDDSTCDQTQNERCKTEGGISSCACRPSYARRKDRDPCRRVVAMVLSIRVDRLYDRKVTWDNKLANKESEPYLQLSYEAVRAVDSAFSMTPYSDEFVSASVNSVYRGEPGQRIHGIFVNCTVLLEESAETVRSNIRADVQRHLLGVITRRSNNVGDSALWVDSPAGSVSALQDLDECSSTELNDCHNLATCTNVWGGFRCECPDSTKDTYSSQPGKAGRDCTSCPNTHCNNRGVCSYVDDSPVCSCSSGYFGSQCEVDGEVLGVSIGASLAALIIIILTLVCLVMWSRRWSREQKTAAGMGSPVFSYMANPIKSPNVGQPPYQVSLEERLRWAQLAEVMAQANHYAQPDSSQNMPTRPSSAMFGHGYPTLQPGPIPPIPLPRHGLHMGSMHHTGTINTMASRGNTMGSQGNLYGGLAGYNMHHTADSTSSDTDSHVQDRVDLLGQGQGQGRNFHVPRPKSRGNNSIANQSGIYYDVEYENAPDAIYGTKGIPLSTYAMSRGPPFYRQ